MNYTIIEPDNFPFLLKQIAKPPDQLYLAGTMPDELKHKFLCVIGARNFSSYGQEVCKELIKGLKGFPIVIVSGLAIGIDSIAHKAALEAGLKTISIPGSGLGEAALYPKAHHELAKEIVELGGAVISPFKPEQIGTRWTFPERNKIMAAISHATLIIEGARGSGTLLTAKAALEFGRDVMVVPGSIFSELSFGPHLLLREGAIPVYDSIDILEHLNLNVKRNDEGDPIQISDDDVLSKEERLLYQNLQNKPLAASDLADRTGITAEKVAIIISRLEMMGYVIEQQGIYYPKN